jgi:hypothetical protein
MLFSSTSYIDKLKQHYKAFFGVAGKRVQFDKGPIEKLHPNFEVLEFPPNKRHNMYGYCTVGMSLDRDDDNLIELVLYSPESEPEIAELLTAVAYYHRNTLPLNLYHTVNIGRPWLEHSLCDHALISLPYLDGPELEFFNYKRKETHCYWLIPITEAERDYKIEHGCETLEQLFEDRQFNYLDPQRTCLTR